MGAAHYSPHRGCSWVPQAYLQIDDVSPGALERYQSRYVNVDPAHALPLINSYVDMHTFQGTSRGQVGTLSWA